ncbi:type III secretion system chaperone [Aquabacterium sp. A7-Y]|uniref:type III secretion system chaperone n=1 Tax=Aquabacterium sp. A7-Y TaxID=1349605 RepID=UPI00223D6E88|nr:type III secretion system chaperone [Aquabacterium sp. A7-Y]MCW7536968.1 type III secretion system chaperone [Aquabacterium sp. A7-Y]
MQTMAEAAHGTVRGGDACPDVTIGGVPLMLRPSSTDHSMELWTRLGELPPARESEVLEAVLLASACLDPWTPWVLGLESASRAVMLRVTMPVDADSRPEAFDAGVDLAVLTSLWWRPLFESPAPGKDADV